MPLTTYTAGEVLTAASLNANFSFAAGGAPTAIFNETQANLTQGGTFTSGSYVKRTLNTTVINDITGCSIASSVITLPAGTYFVSAIAPALQVSNHKTRLQNTTDSTTIAIGTTNTCAAADTTQTNAELTTYFTLAASKTIELQHRCATTAASYGLGTAMNFSDNEVYSSITITKVA
jgi:hypothetical protein